jgi:hypothetical protein
MERPLEGVVGKAVALDRPVVSATHRDHRGVLARAVVVDRLGRPAVLEPAVELALLASGLAQKRPNRLDVHLGAEVRRRSDREILLVEVLVGAREGQRLNRLRSRAQ